jgi:CubicO group peptidase (beta-lactamase class C family)
MDVVDHAALADLVGQFTGRHPSVGLAVGVAGPDGLAEFVGHGVANVESGAAITQDTGFRIASISKTFTALAVMQLVEQGRVDLDAPAEDYLRAYRLVGPRPDSPPPSVRQLLTHTAGMPELAHVRGALSADFGESVPLGQRRPTLAEFYGGQVRLRADPGRRFVYGNHSPATLGQLVEDVTGTPLGQHFANHLFAPLGMTATTTDLSAAVGRLASGYEIRGRRVEPIALREMITVGAAGVISTPQDLGRYLAALLRGGSLGDGQILTPDALAQMFAPQVQPDPRLPGVGLAFYRVSLGGGVIAVGHQGTLPGFHSQVLLLPEAGVAAMVLTNGSRQADFWVPTAAARVLRLAARIPEPSLPMAPHHPEVWDDICGWYRLDAAPTDVRLRGMLGAGLEIFLRGGRPAIRFLTPVPALARGLDLEPADPQDPYMFRIRLDDMEPLGMVVTRGPGQTPQVHLGMMPLILTKQPAATNPRRWALAALGGAAIAALAGRATAELRG